MLKHFSQVKLSSTGSQTVFDLFKIFNLHSNLLNCKIVKQKGHSIIELIFSFLVVILENSNSIYSGIIRNHISNLKTPMNDMLNNPNYNWRNLLYRIAKRFSQLCPVDNINDCCLIFDDTSKAKTGRKTQNSSWFYDHSKNTYFKGFQNITAAWTNGRTAIPIDFEFKIGRKRTKHSRKANYPRGSHINQRVRFSKQKKHRIVIQMIKRALQRKFQFKYVLWDSWYNNSESYSYIFKELLPRGKVMISMLKRGFTKYKYGKKYMELKELYGYAGKWQKDRSSGIKFKSLEVEILDTSSSKKIENRLVIGRAKICFFKYPNVRNWKAIISTDPELETIEILKIYLKRWSIECIFKEIRQYFGYAQSKSSNYSAMVADLTIRYVFYVLFCYQKETRNNKPMGQIMVEFYQELFEVWLKTYIELMFINYIKDFMQYAIENGWNNLVDLKENIKIVLEDFFRQITILNKISESDIHEYRQTA